MSDVGLTLRQVRVTNKTFWRNPASAFFTFAFPLMFLVIFTSLLANGNARLGHTNLSLKTYYVVAMASFGVITACYTNIAIQTSFNRDAGILKRTKGTPLPGWAYLTARVIHAMIVAALLVVISAGFGKFAYGADLPSGVPLLEFILTLIVGSLCFAFLALALTASIPNADAAPAIVNASILPLLFLSGIFIPITDRSPAWIRTIAAIFPVRHFFEAMIAGFLGNGTVQTPVGPVRAFPYHWTDLLVVAIWGLAGLILAARYFSWEPRR